MAGKTKVQLVPHALQRLGMRGVTKEQVEDTALNGTESPARDGRIQREKHFPYQKLWKGTWYAGVLIVAICEPTVGGVCLVVTVISKFTGKKKTA